MRNLRIITGVLGLAVVLALAGCGQSDAPQASLEVSSVPAAEIYVDGVSHGTSPAAISLSAGDHQVELRLDKFESFETRVTLAATETQAIDAVLTAQDPSDPIVIAKLAAAEGVDLAPFVAPELTRGSARKTAAAILLWPGKDVRRDGLVNYAIEADETYAGDATLEFRHGRKVLYREPFNPETVTTVRSIPAEVLEHIRVGNKIRWGLYFEDRRRAITSEFRIVQRRKADQQLVKLAKSRHVARQPEITQQIMQATVLENNRLYTEALAMNLSIVIDHPGSTQPYRGIVTTLRRLDAEDSELFALVSSNVGGRGGRSGVSRPGISGRTSADGLGIEAWSPSQSTAAPTPAVPTETGARRSGAARGVTPPAQPGAQQPTPADGATPPEIVDGPSEAVDPMREALERQTAELETLERQAADAEQLADDTRATAEEAQRQAQAADDALAAARAAVADGEEPTREQRQQIHDANEAALAARQGADDAQRAADEANRSLLDLQTQMVERNAQLEDMRTALDAAGGTEPVPAAPPAVQPRADREQLERNLQEAESTAEQARSTWEEATSALDQAEQAYHADPSRDNLSQLEAARGAVADAAQSAYESQQQVEAARNAMEGIGNQVRESNPK